MNHRQLLTLLLALVFIAALGGASYCTRDQWLPLLDKAPPDAANGPAAGPEPARKKILITDEAEKNLGLTSEQVKAQIYWKTIQVPGMIVDRPGQSDHCVVAPATGVVARVGHFPGETIRPGDVLFTIKLQSDSLHLAQTELVKATHDIKLAQKQRQRLLDNPEVVPAAKLIEVDEQIARLQVAVKAYRQELLNRGLALAQVDKVAAGDFIGEIPVVAPPVRTDSGVPAPAFEVQELKVELGQQVQAGQTLCLIANHQSLAIEGRAFPDETPLLQRCVKEGWPVEVDFLEDPSTRWPPLAQSFFIRQMNNTIDPVNRTFAFHLPLENQSQVVKSGVNTQTLWRFRPGQMVRLHVRVEKLDNVFVLPKDALVREGPEAFVFTQNVNTFERKPVHVLHKDRQHVVLANDGSLVPGSFVAQCAAVQLNRLIKTQSNSVPKGYHMHADGALHKNEDEGK